jgi:hypothetical protein
VLPWSHQGAILMLEIGPRSWAPARHPRLAITADLRAPGIFAKGRVESWFVTSVRDEDRVFLSEYASLMCLAHPVAALAFHRAAVDADEVAVVAESLTRLIHRAEAESMAATRNSAAMVQTYVVARLMGELAATIEDCAAIGDAIRYRNRGGLFERYLRSKSSATGTFWSHVRAGLSLPDLLDLPALDALSVQPEDRSLLEQDYANLPPALAQISDLYRGEGVPKAWSPTSTTSVPEDVVNVVVDIVTPASDGSITVTRVTLLEVYNKIKHRFAVFHDVAALGSAVRARGGSVVHATYPRAPEFGERLLMNVIAVAQTSGEMAALVLRLDELGVLPD